MQPTVSHPMELSLEQAVAGFHGVVVVGESSVADEGSVVGKSLVKGMQCMGASTEPLFPIS